MTPLTSILALALGFSLFSCGGANQPAKIPSSHADEQADERTDAQTGVSESAGQGDDQQSKSSKAPDSADDDSSAPPSASGTESGKAIVEQQDEKSPGECQKSSAKLAISVDRNSVNLEKGTLRAKLDGPICSLVMKITLKDGQPTLEKSFDYSGSERELKWNPVPRDQIEKVEIRVTANDNAYQAVQLVPWSVSIDHKEVEFDTNRAVVRDPEVTSLNDSLSKIKGVLSKVDGKGLGTITLFIAGHTDTQGSDEHNMTLSRSRAQAIASWFMKNGLCIPIAFEGFGETALKKVTADNVDEQANRRVDYILAVEPPMTRKGATPAWKWISKGCS